MRDESIEEVSPLKDLNYESYLKVPELLGLQQTVTDPAHHDELLFIIVHQAFELWFKLALHETAALNQAFASGKGSRAHKVLTRLFKLQEVWIAQIHTLASLAPDEFGAFRDRLRPASGFQSVQFREMEFRWGLKDPRFLGFFRDLPYAQERLKAALAAPTVYDRFLGYLAGRGHAIPTEVLERDVSDPYEANEGVLAALLAIYEDSETHDRDYFLCEQMVELDQNLALWRHHHVTMVERTIGRKVGTGGSSGAAYLRSTLEKRCFPELWDLRTRFGSY